MTRSDRIIGLVAYVVAFLLLFAAAAAIGSLGPIEFAIVLVLAIPAAVLLARGVRVLTARGPRPRA